VRIFRATVLNSLLFHSYLFKVLYKHSFDWAIIGEGTIVLRILSIRGTIIPSPITEDFQQGR
jgi:hypothetical protein